MKRCARCGEARPVSDFTVDRAKKDGRGSYCKPCRAAYFAAYRQRPGVAEKLDARSRQWAKDHPEVQRRRGQKPAARERMRRYHEEHRDRRAEAGRRRYAANPEPAKARARRWRQANPERFRAQVKRRGALRRGASVGEVVRPELVYERDGFVCWLCEEATEPAGIYGRRPSMDHVVALSLGGAHSYENVRTAHRSCNSSRGVGHRAST